MLFSAGSPRGNTKRSVVVIRKKSYAARSADQVEEPEAGRMIQSQVSNLVSGVVPCLSRITHATSDRVGACGAKLHERLQKNTSGRPACGFPSGSRSIRQSVRTGQARMFLPRKGSPAGDWSAPCAAAPIRKQAQMLRFRPTQKGMLGRDALDSFHRRRPGFCGRRGILWGAHDVLG